MFLNLTKMYLQNYLKAGLTRSICARRAIHSNTVVVIWLSNVKFGSKITPRSLVDCTGEMFPKKTNEIHGA